ncbi:MAG: response regulator [Nitrospirae bacterium]|nr:response regulator [Nitrospirota bacterium]
MNKTIMTVDDSASIRMMVQFTLIDLGYDIVMAANGKEALEKLTNKKMPKIDLLITDFNMPVLNGIGLIKSVREIPDYKFMPIIMLTTEFQPEKKFEGRQAGATSWLVKPFKPEQLVAVVKRMIG